MDSPRWRMHTALSHALGATGKASSGMSHPDPHGRRVAVGFGMVSHIYNALRSPEGRVMDL